MNSDMNHKLWLIQSNWVALMLTQLTDVRSSESEPQEQLSKYQSRKLFVDFKRIFLTVFDIFWQKNQFWLKIEFLITSKGVLGKLSGQFAQFWWLTQSDF